MKDEPVPVAPASTEAEESSLHLVWMQWFVGEEVISAFVISGKKQLTHSIDSAIEYIGTVIGV